jgi:hypothetical protein
MKDLGRPPAAAPGDLASIGSKNMFLMIPQRINAQHDSGLGSLNDQPEFDYWIPDEFVIAGGICYIKR